MKKDKELELRIQILNLQRERLLERWEKKKKRDAFVKKNLKKILALSTNGWPRTKEMKDYIKWFDLICEAKIKGIYSMGSANCDVIMLLSNTADKLKKAQ